MDDAELAKRSDDLTRELRNTKRECGKAKAVLIAKAITAGILTVGGVITGTLFPNPIAVGSVAAGAAIFAGLEASKVSYKKLRREVTDKKSKKAELVQIATQQATNKMRDDIIAQQVFSYQSSAPPMYGEKSTAGGLYPDPRV